MIVLGLTDIHGQIGRIDRLQEELAAADIVALVGDITNFGRAADVAQVLGLVRKHAGKIMAVSGNCDYPEVEQELDRQNVNLHARGELWDGLGFIGLGGSLTTPFKTPNEYSEGDLAGFLDRAKKEVPPEAPMVLIAHQPPKHTNCDRLRTGDHVGSTAVRSFIEKHQPLVCFTGHIHESVGTDRIGMTRIVNPGQLGQGRYAYAKIEGDRVTVEIREF